MAKVEINVKVKTADFEKQIERAANAARKLKRELDRINKTPVEIITKSRDETFFEWIINKMKNGY